jgi:hypothetical protein
VGTTPAPAPSSVCLGDAAVTAASPALLLTSAVNRTNRHASITPRHARLARHISSRRDPFSPVDMGGDGSDGNFSSGRLVRNVYVLSAGFFGVFLAFNTAQVRQPRRRPPPTVRCAEPPVVAVRVSQWRAAAAAACRRLRPLRCPPPCVLLASCCPAPRVSRRCCRLACADVAYPDVPLQCHACAQSLETTIVSNKKVGDVSLAILYGLFTCMAIPAPRLVQMIGPK